MNILPCIFTCGRLYGDRLLFGLWVENGIQPVRAIASNKVRAIGAPKAEAVPDELDIVLAGRECLEALSRLELLGPILMSMAGDMEAAVKSQMSKRAQGTDKRFTKQNAENAYWSLIHGK